MEEYFYDLDKDIKLKIANIKDIFSKEKFLRNCNHIDNLINEYKSVNYIKYVMIYFGYSYLTKFFQLIKLHEYKPDSIIYSFGN